MAAKAGKNAIQTCGLKIRPRYTFLILIPCTARSQNRFHVAPYDELTSLLRRCRLCAATVEPKALFSEPVSGSGAVAETVLCRNDAEKLPRTCGMQNQVSTAHSAQGSEETFGLFRLFCPLFQLLGKVGRRRQNKKNIPSHIFLWIPRGNPVDNVPLPRRCGKPSPFPTMARGEKRAGNKGLVPFFHIFFSYDEYYE